MKKIKISLNNIFLLCLTIIFSLITISCTEDSTNVLPETTLLKGFTQINGRDSDSLILDFEYDNNKLISTKLFNNRDGESRFIFTYNSNGIDNVIVNQLKDNSQTKLQFEYSGNSISMITGTEKGKVSYMANYSYQNGKLFSVNSLRYEDNKVVDSTYCNDFINNRPGIIEYFYFDENFKKLKLSRKEKLVYQNGNMIEKYELNQENNKWQLREKRTFNNEIVLFASIQDFVLLFDNVPYIPGNIDKNNFLTYESYYNYCNSQTFDEAQLTSKDTYIYKKDNNGKINSIEMVNEEYCGATAYNNYVILKY